MLVEIRQEHSMGANFSNVCDCPLHRAIRQQHPEFNLHTVSLTRIADRDGRSYLFTFSKWEFPWKFADAQEIMKEAKVENVWNPAVNSLLREGKRESVLLYIDTPEYDRQQAAKLVTNPCRELLVLNQ